MKAASPDSPARAAQEFFKRTFGIAPARTVVAPGRLELLGNHTDYNQGLVLAVAVDRATAIAVAQRSDGQIELASSAFPERVKFPIDSIFKDPAAPWANYVKGVLRQLRQRGAHFTGFNAAIHSTIPHGGGLGSSAALEVATALAVRELHPYALTSTGCTVPPRRGADGALPPLTTAEKLEIAKLCLAAENEFVGVQCGLLDQISSLFGKAHHAIELDCQSLAIEPVPMFGEVAIVVCPTGVQHALAGVSGESRLPLLPLREERAGGRRAFFAPVGTREEQEHPLSPALSPAPRGGEGVPAGGEYNELRRHCEAAAAALGVKSLRAIDPPRLAANKTRLTAREHDCAFHIVGENQRVMFGARALRDGDFEQFGQFMFQSHESSRDFFKNSCAELDLLVELARRHAACFGARLTGGGFGGSTVNLVRSEDVEDFIRAVVGGYEERTRHRIEPMRCQSADGAP